MIAVTGATGFIGRHLVPVLLQTGKVPVRALTRQHIKDDPAAGIDYVQGDISDQRSLRFLLESGATLVNLAWSNTASLQDAIAQARMMVETCAHAGISRLVHCSSVSVYGRVRGIVTEHTQCVPRDKYGSTKLAIEQILLEQTQDRFELIILRPTEVFGVGGKALLSLMDSLRSRNRGINYIRSSLFGRRRMHLVPVKTVVDAIRFFCRDNRKYGRETFNISADSELLNNFRDIESLLMEELNLPAWPFPPLTLPRFLLESILLAAGRPVIDSQVLYSSRKLQEWGFHNNHSLEQALRMFARTCDNQALSG